MFDTQNLNAHSTFMDVPEGFPVPHRPSLLPLEHTHPGRRLTCRSRSRLVSQEIDSNEQYRLRVQRKKRKEPGAAKVSDQNVVAVLRAIHQCGGMSALQMVLRQLSKDDLGAIRPQLESRWTEGKGHWYSFELYCRLLHAVDEVLLAAGFPDHLYEFGKLMGRREVKRILGDTHESCSPGWLFEMTDRLWGQYHSMGQWKIERTPVSIIASLEEHPNTDPVFCTVFMGWIVGAVNPKTNQTFEGSHALCRARGAPRCVYTCRWE